MRLLGQLAYAEDEGIKKGTKEGIKQGIEENKIEVIKAMLNKNIGYNIISEVTNKSIEEIKKIEATM